jgi:hypothetical protein
MEGRLTTPLLRTDWRHPHQHATPCPFCHPLRHSPYTRAPPHRLCGATLPQAARLFHTCQLCLSLETSASRKLNPPQDGPCPSPLHKCVPGIPDSRQFPTSRIPANSGIRQRWRRLVQLISPLCLWDRSCVRSFPHSLRCWIKQGGIASILWSRPILSLCLFLGMIMTSLSAFRTDVCLDHGHQQHLMS